MNMSARKRSVILSSHERGHDRNDDSRTAAHPTADAGPGGHHHADGGSTSDGHLLAPGASAQRGAGACGTERTGARQSGNAFIPTDTGRDAPGGRPALSG